MALTWFWVFQSIVFVFWLVIVNWDTKYMLYSFAWRPAILRNLIVVSLLSGITYGWIGVASIWAGYSLGVWWGLGWAVVYWLIRRKIAHDQYVRAYKQNWVIHEHFLKEEGKLETTSFAEIDRLVRSTLESNLEQIDGSGNIRLK